MTDDVEEGKEDSRQLTDIHNEILSQVHAHRLLLEHWKIITSIGKPSRQHHEMEYEFSSVGKAPSDINTFPLSCCGRFSLSWDSVDAACEFHFVLFPIHSEMSEKWVEEKIMKNSRFKWRNENQILSHRNSIFASVEWKIDFGCDARCWELNFYYRPAARSRKSSYFHIFFAQAADKRSQNNTVRGVWSRFSSFSAWKRVCSSSLRRPRHRTFAAHTENSLLCVSRKVFVP